VARTRCKQGGFLYNLVTAPAGLPHPLRTMFVSTENAWRADCQTKTSPASKGVWGGYDRFKIQNRETPCPRKMLVEKRDGWYAEVSG